MAVLPSDVVAQMRAALALSDPDLDTTVGTERPHLQEWVDRGW